MVLDQPMNLESKTDREREQKVADLLDVYLKNQGCQGFYKTKLPDYHSFDYRYDQYGKTWFFLEIKTRTDPSTKFNSLLLEASKYERALKVVPPVKVLVQWSDCTMAFTLKEGYEIIKKEITHPKTKKKEVCEFVEIPFKDGKKLW